MRALVEDDAPAFVALLAAVALEERWIATEWPFDVAAREREVRAALRGGFVVGWGVFEHGRLTAVLTVHEPDEPEPPLGMMVDAASRGRGHGGALLDAAGAWARAAGKDALQLQVFPDNAAAIGLYRKHGFEQTALERAAVRRRDGSRRDALRMRKAF